MTQKSISEFTAAEDLQDGDVFLIERGSANLKVPKALVDPSGKADTSHTHTAADVSDFDTEVANNSAVAANTAKTGITAQQAADITANNAKRTYPSADETKLAAIESGATADQTGGEIKTLYEAEANTNAFTDAEKSKLGAIEENATADQSGSEIVAAVDSELGNTDWKQPLTTEQVQDIIGALFQAGTHTNITVTYDDVANTISLAATGGGGLDQEQAEDIVANLVAVSGGGISVTYDDVAGTLTFALTGESYTTAEKTKLAAIAAGATANDTDANLKDRANHTGTQAISTVTGLQTALDGKAASSHSHTLSDVSDAGTAAALDVPATGDAAIDEVVKGNDTRLTDARTPTAHTHVLSDITDAGTAAALNVAVTGDAASGEVVKGNDSRLTDARTPTSHTHTASEVTDFDTEVANNSDVAANTTARHSHSNKALLDTYTQTEANLADAVSKKHSHSNQSVLDNTTASFTSADETKLDNITVTQPVNLDQMETDIAALANGMVYKGDWDASGGSFPGSGSAQTGWFFYVSVGGTVDGIVFNVGDNLVATTDNASTTTYAANWSKHDQTDAVSSVAGKTGSVTLVAADIGDFDTEVGNQTDVAANTAARHSHANKTVLDNTTASFTTADEAKLDAIEAGAEVNNISDVNATDLTDGGASTLHYHASDRDRANHTGTQAASTISDFDTEVSNNSDVVANTTARHSHSNKSVLDAITASFTTADETKLNGIETGATADQTGAEIAAAVSGNSITDVRGENIILTRSTYPVLIAQQSGSTGVGQFAMNGDWLELRNTQAYGIRFFTNNTQRATFLSDGKFGIGTTSPSHLLDINSDSFRLRTAKTPSSATDTGSAGQIAWDAKYIYVCTATNTWRRVPHSTFGTATLTDGATINWDVSTHDVAKVTLGGNRTMAAPTNLVDGHTYALRVIQDGTGSRTITWNSVFKWPDDTAPTLSTAAGAIDIITFVSDGTNLYGVVQNNFS